ncbi:MAG: hypothetical protein IKK42_04110 [Oscillospiraceae bacterium]|nr:hypothetical protein [Oscillospiraceae bacterium]
METTALIISDQLQDLNRMKNWFPKGITVKGINTFSAVPSALRSELPSLIIVRIRDFGDFFSAYEAIRTTPVTENVPLIAIADIAIGDALKDNVLLKNTTLMGSSVTDGYMKKIISDEMGIHNN